MIKVMKYLSSLFLGLIIFGNLSSVPVQAASNDYQDILERALEQIRKEDHTPLSPPTEWRMKWLVFTDVTFNQNNGAIEHSTLDSNGQIYAQTVAEDFKEIMKKYVPSVQLTIDVEFYQEPLSVDAAAGKVILQSHQVEAIIKEKVPYGKYDSVFVANGKASKGGLMGLTTVNYYSEQIQGAGFCSFGLINVGTNNYPKHSTDREAEYSTILALHEFCHQLSFGGLIETYPDVHNASGYGYVEDPKNEWLHFYTDYLSGKIIDDKTRKQGGIYPEMWRLSPRFYKENPLIRNVNWIFKPTGEPDELLDNKEKIYIPISYKNRFGSDWFDLRISAGKEYINQEKMMTGNKNIIAIRNFDGGILRVNIVGIGETELVLQDTTGNIKYTKTIVVYDDSKEQQGTAPEKQTLILNKLMYKGNKPQIANTGETIQLQENVRPFDADKYGSVDFTMVDITTYAKGKSIQELQSVVENLTADNYAAFIAKYKERDTYAVTNKMSTGSRIEFPNVTGLKDDTPHTYVLFETRSAKSLVNQIAQPMVICLPVQNSSGDGYNDTVQLYPKNEVKDLELELIKYSESIQAGNELSGAKFDVYQGFAGSGTKINTAPLISNGQGRVKVTGLTLGDYYLVETEAPNGFSVSGSALNNTNNKLIFSIGEEGVEESELSISYVNYKKPESNKTVENGTAPKTNYSSFTIGDAINYTNTLRIPTDINGGSLVNGKLTETTTPYHVFNYSDTAGKGLSYFGTSEEVNVLSETGTKLMEGIDYTYSRLENGFALDFIGENGRVSQKVAALAGKTLKIEYTMILNEEAEIAAGLYNNFDLAWNNDPSSNAENDTKHIEGSVPIYTGGAIFEKQDATTQAKLADAEFLILNKEGRYFGGFADSNADGIKNVRWVTTEADAQKLVSDENGRFEIAGLAYGEYTLKEIKAPSGYALLTTTKDFTINELTYKETVAVITNTKQSELPITGSTQILVMLIGGITVLVTTGIYFKNPA